MRSDFTQVLARVAEQGEPSLTEVVYLLRSEEADELEQLYAKARAIRDEYCGRRMVVRGLVEFSSYCKNSCNYCGLNRFNQGARRYRLSERDIFASADLIYRAGFRTIVLQSGEDAWPADQIAKIICEIKTRYDMAITLSVGERPKSDYKAWKDAGADRYLLRIESSDAALYQSLHQGRELKTRLKALEDLKDLGYQCGSGIMIGPPGQSLEHIAKDILYLIKQDFDMIGIGPFIPHPQTIYAHEKAGSLPITLKALALLRILSRNAWLPATTALGSLDRDYRVDALKAGANVLMPNFSPAEAKKNYEIYPNKRCIDECTEACPCSSGEIARAAGLKLDYSRADSLKPGFLGKID